MSRHFAGCLCVLALLAGCEPDDAERANATLERPSSTTRPIEPIPAAVDVDPSKVALGEELFHDKRLSRDNSIACAGCHALDTGGVDKRRTSVGIGGAVGPINSPTVWNSGFSFRQFWDGRAASLEEQADGPVHAAAEMGSSWPEVIEKLSADQDFSARFQKVYPSGLTAENLRDAIATFERSLVTPNSAFDQFLNGDESALTEQQAAGYRMFLEYGCVSCHQGVAMGGNMFQRFGIMGDYFADRGNVTEADLGRYNVTKKEEDKHLFKVPSLRNVELTAPYFHDGSAETLAEAVQVMAKYQLGRELDREEVGAVVAFLESTTGEYKSKSLRSLGGRP
jgi:cytochrome c peroxidase